MKKIKLFLLGTLSIATLTMSAQNGLHFDRVNDYVQTTYNGVLGSANRTFEAWVYVDASAPPANLCILDYGLNLVGSRNTFNVTGSRGINFLSGGTNANIGSSAGLVPDNQWTHVAFVLFNGTGFLYVNGSQVGTGNLTTVNTPLGSNLRIGQRVAGGSILFGGRIDEVRVWNVAKTQAAIVANMNNELCGSPANLTAYYKLNEGVVGGANAAVTAAVDEVAAANGNLLNFALTGATSNWVAGKTLSLGNVVSSQTLNECPGFSITVGTSTYTATGNYSDTLVGASVLGCDSIINTDLTIIDATYNQTISGCAGLSITVGSNTYTTTGNYSDTLVGAGVNGCDSIINTSLTIASAIDTTVTSNFLDLTSNQVGATYQWLSCDSNYAVIPNDTNQTFTGVGNGSYAVEVTIGNCIDTSGCTTVVGVGINEFSQKTVSIYPNPASNVIQVNLGAQVAVLNYSLTSITGEVIRENTEVNTSAISIDISNQAKGVYFLKLNNATYKIIKK